MSRPWILLAALIVGSVTMTQAQDHDHDHAADQGDGHQHEQKADSHDGHHDGDDAHGGHKHHEGVHHDFSDVHRWFGIFEGEDRDQFQKPEHVIALMEIEPSMTVADIGAGTGYFLPHLSKAVGSKGKVWGLDPEVNLVEFMQRRTERDGWTNVEARQIPLDTPDIEAGSADRILIVNTWHHIDDREDYSAKLREALAEGGRVYVVDYTKESPRGPSVEHRLTEAQVIEELKAGGLEGKVLKEDLPWQYIVVASR